MGAINNIIIIGAGQGACQCANSLRSLGFDGAIKIFGDEGLNPYQRPPLSKAFLMGQTTVERLEFKAKEQWVKDNIEIYNNSPVVGIDRLNKKIITKNNQTHSYDKLIIASGSRVRKIETMGAELDNIHYLKSLEDSCSIKANFETAKSIAIIGAGYIGLEVAAIARKFGLEVNVIELAPRILARVACEELSQFFEDLHQEHGVKFHKSQGVEKFIGNGKVEKIILNNGHEIMADMVLIGIGILPNQELAMAANIECDNGIITNEYAQTNDENIYAIGDCANRNIEVYGQRLRLESVHNALEQGKIAAAHIMNAPMPKLEVPWFWSDQYDIKLQIVGLNIGVSKTVIRGNKANKKFAIFHLDKENRIMAIDAINSPPEFLLGKNLIAAKAHITPERIADNNISAKELLN